MNSSAGVVSSGKGDLRDRALELVCDSMPYASTMGIHFERRGDELTSVMEFSESLIGNQRLRALHGGATASFLEVTAIVELAYRRMWSEIETGQLLPSDIGPANIPVLPKTIDIALDYLRPGMPADSFARARVNRIGRRYASVSVEAWQEGRDKLFALATGHFLIPEQWVNDAFGRSK